MIESLQRNFLRTSAYNHNEMIVIGNDKHYLKRELLS